MKLAQSLRLTCTTRLAVVGAGGKTTALFQVARELLEMKGVSQATVFVTATTHLAVEQLKLADVVQIVHGPQDVALVLNSQIPTGNISGGVVLWIGPEGDDHRMTGLDEATLVQVRRLADQYGIPLLIEADGSRCRPLKAPADYEPVIPAWVDTVIVVVGLAGIDQPLNEEWVHRSERFAKLSGLLIGAAITPEAVVKVLTHPSGGLKGIPAQARRIALLNQADTLRNDSFVEKLALAGRLAGMLVGQYHAVLVCGLKTSATVPDGGVWAVYQPVAGIVLAAGSSQRFGQPKQLLQWHGRSFVEHAARTALEAGLSPVVVVSGAYHTEVESVLGGLPVQIAYNSEWASGQSSSLVAGLKAVGPEVGAAVFLLVDQPCVSANLIRSLVQTHAQTLAPVVAPLVGDRRANPVLFDWTTFSDLLSLQGDTGGRAIFARHRVTWLPWHDASILLDIDTLEDYQKLQIRNTDRDLCQ